MVYFCGLFSRSCKFSKLKWKSHPVASVMRSPTAAWSSSRRWRMSSGSNLYWEFAWGVADHVGDSVGDGHFRHLNRCFHRIRAVVHTRKNVAMNVNHVKKSSDSQDTRIVASEQSGSNGQFSFPQYGRGFPHTNREDQHRDGAAQTCRGKLVRQARSGQRSEENPGHNP